MVSPIQARNLIRGSFFFIISQLSFVIIFSFLYLLLEWYEPGVNFGDINCKDKDTWCSNYLTLFYFSLVTQATVGYGDIVPKTQKAKFLVIIQLILVYIGIAATAVIPGFLRRMAGGGNKNT